MIGKVAEADVMRPRNLSRVSPLTIIYHPTGQEYPPQHSCWFVEDMVEPHHIVRGLPVTVLIHSIGTEVKPIRVVSPVSTHPLPFPGQDMPGWFGKLFRISLPGPLIPAYGGAPVVVTDEPNRLVGFIIRSYYTQSGQFAAYCGLAWPL